MRELINLMEAHLIKKVGVDSLPYETKQDILAMLLVNCPAFEDYWMEEHGVMSFNQTYVSQFIFGYEIDHHPDGDGSEDENWFPVSIIDLAPDEIDNTNRSVSDNVVAQYAKMTTTPPLILVRRQGTGWRIVEGGHRIAAAKIRGVETIRAVDVTIFFETDWSAL
jgi:hypothetical protein